MNSSISPLALECLSQLNAAGYKAYLVGGCVRDLIQGLFPHDYDLCTNALPEEIQNVFAADKTILTGLRHGTVTVVKKGEPFEITTFRKESGYSDSRHPDAVSFTADLKEDLSRRDFTMNAIAYSPEEGFVDPFDGGKAIRHKRISCVGDPLLRVEEDALRMLRAVRFEACLGFAIDPITAFAIERRAPKIADISRERIKEELTKILLSSRAFEGTTRLLHFLGAGIFGEEAALLTPSPVLNRVSACEPLRYAAFLLNSGSAAEILRSLHCSNQLVRSVTAILNAVHSGYPTTAVGARQLCRDAGDNALQAAELIDLCSGHPAMTMSGLVSAVLNCRDPVTLSSLAINGTDLASAGIPSGKETGRILNYLLDMVIQFPEKNKKNILLKEAIKFYDLS